MVGRQVVTHLHPPFPSLSLFLSLYFLPDFHPQTSNKTQKSRSPRQRPRPDNLSPAAAAADALGAPGAILGVAAREPGPLVDVPAAADALDVLGGAGRLGGLGLLLLPLALALTLHLHLALEERAGREPHAEALRAAQRRRGRRRLRRVVHGVRGGDGGFDRGGGRRGGG